MNPRGSTMEVEGFNPRGGQSNQGGWNSNFSSGMGANPRAGNNRNFQGYQNNQNQ